MSRFHRILSLPGRARRPRLVAAAAVTVVVLAGVAVGGFVYYRNRTGDVYHPHARFVPQAVPRLPTRGPSRFAWPLYGYTKDHTRFFPASPTLHPPFTIRWVHNGSALLEFPPVMYGNTLFQLDDDGFLNAINKATGHTFWSRRVGMLSASSPAASSDTVYATVMRRPGGGGGRVAALDARTGAVRWTRNLPSPSESSPLLDHGNLYFGSQNGTVYALDARTGGVRWTYHAGGSVKASPTLGDGKLFFGDYGGHVQAIRESDGHRVWSSGSGGAVFGSGQFYSTPAVVYGRVFLGNTDGRVYAYDESTGRLDWAKQTGAYVYSSPAVADAPGLGPTIYLGSYDGNFYALDARSGQVRWEYRAGGRISGSATILGRIVYFADLGHHRTIGLGISTGQPQFRLDSGAFDPVITDGDRVYLTGYTGLYALQPAATVGPPAPSARASPARAPRVVPVPRRPAARPHRRSGANHRARSAQTRQVSRRRGQTQRAAHARHRADRRHRARPESSRRSAHRSRRPPKVVRAAPPRPAPVYPAARPLALSSTCESRFLVMLTTLESGACRASGKASGTG